MEPKIGWMEIAKILIPLLTAGLGAWMTILDKIRLHEADVRVEVVKTENKFHEHDRQFGEITKKDEEQDRRLDDYEYWIRDKGSNEKRVR